jgi:CheY-like chemotaxis protein
VSPKSHEPVLVVDDDDDARALIRDRLEADGYTVIEAKNGQAALDILVTNPASEPCLIVLDLNMPVMSGWQFLAIVKSYARLARIPVVVVSGIEPHAETLAREEVVAWIKKPCPPMQLASLVEKYARKHCG